MGQEKVSGSSEGKREGESGSNKRKTEDRKKYGRRDREEDRTSPASPDPSPASLRESFQRSECSPRKVSSAGVLPQHTETVLPDRTA